MNIIEYGRQHDNVMILLHGGGLSWWNYEETAELLGSYCHVILPVLDGHAQSGHSFSSIEENARRIISLIDAQYGGRVLLIGGLSLGGQIAAEILSQRKDICRYAVLESVSIIPSPLTARMLAPSIRWSFPLIQQKWFARMQFDYLKIKPSLFDRYYTDSCAIGMDDMISFLKASTMYHLNPTLAESQAQLLIAAGEKESAVIRRSAHRLHTLLPESTLLIKKGLHHGEFSINHPREYARELLRLTALS